MNQQVNSFHRRADLKTSYKNISWSDLLYAVFYFHHDVVHHKTLMLILSK